MLATHTPFHSRDRHERSDYVDKRWTHADRVIWCKYSPLSTVGICLTHQLAPPKCFQTAQARRALPMRCKRRPYYRYAAEWLITEPMAFAVLKASASEFLRPERALARAKPTTSSLRF